MEEVRSGDGAFGLAADINGRIHLTGYAYTDNPFVQFSGIPLILQGGSDIFHVIYDTSGTIISLMSDGGGSDQEAHAISLDNDNNVYITGRFLDSAAFSGTHHTGFGIYDAFVVMYDSSGNYITSRHYGAQNYDVGFGITTDVFGNCTSTGTFHNNVQFGNTSLSSGGNFDSYLATLNDTIIPPGGLIPSNYHTGNSALRSNNITDIIVDVNNVVYSATADSGVYRFDGINWSTINCPSNSINSLFADSVNNIWICTSDSGLLKYDGSVFTTFNIFNSGLPTNNITSATALPGQVIWIGTTDKGCVRFDGTNYTIFDTTSSALPSNHISTMNCDSSGTYWMGSVDAGLTSFKNGVFTVYNTGNSAIPSNNIKGANIDTAGNKIWVATDNGLASFDGTAWSVFDTTTGLPSNQINDIIITKGNQQNIGSERKGAVVNSGTVLRNANTSNALFDNNITTIYADTSGQVIWLGTQYNGIYRLVDTSSVIGIVEVFYSLNDFMLTCYPNPASDQLHISFNLLMDSEVNIKIYDISGREVKRILLNKKSKGNYHQALSIHDLSSGIYTLKVITASGVGSTRFVRESAR